MDRVLSAAAAAERIGVKLQAIYLAIWKQRLKAYRNEDEHWRILESDLLIYKDGKYKRENSSLINGQKIYSGNNLSVGQAAEMLGESTQYIYNEVYSGRLKSSYLGAHLIVFRDEIEEILKQNGEVAHL